MFVSKKKYAELLEENEALKKQIEILFSDLIKAENELNELKKKNESSYFG